MHQRLILPEHSALLRELTHYIKIGTEFACYKVLKYIKKWPVLTWFWSEEPEGGGIGSDC